MKEGDKVVLEFDGRSVDATVVIASPNSRSLLVEYEALVDGCLGKMPLFDDKENGTYVNLITGNPIGVRLRST